MIRYRLQQAWYGFTLKISLDRLTILNQALYRAEILTSQAAQLERDLGLAQAAIADLKSKLPSDWEAKQRAASDKLAEAAIDDMNRNPKKYLP